MDQIIDRPSSPRPKPQQQQQPQGFRHTYSKTVTIFPLSSTCRILVRAQGQCGGVPCYTCPRVTVQKEHVSYTQRNENGDNPVKKNFAIHLTAEEYERFKLAIEPVNATLSFMDSQELVAAYFSSMSVSPHEQQTTSRGGEYTAERRLKNCTPENFFRY